MLLLEEVTGTDDVLEDLVDRAERLGMFPEIAAEVRDVIREPGASAQDLERIVRKDASLTARILRTANSPFYGGRRVVSSLRHALVVLGFRDAAQLALAFAMVARDFERPASEQVVKRAVRVAICAQELARHTRTLEPSEAFVAGMLHDFGALVLLEVLGDHYEGVLTDPMLDGQKLLRAERAVAHADHCEVAEACLVRWRFSRSTSMAIRHHHRPLQHAGFDGRPAFNGDALISIATWFAAELEAGTSDGEIARGLVVHPHNEALEIGMDRAEEVVAAVKDELGL